jgi:predicted amidohydrolase YtcJ
LNSLLIHNANILSFQDGFVPGTADTLVVAENSIEAVGRYDELKNLAHGGTVIIDAGGKTLMPGFNDSHIHIWKVGSLKTFMLDIRGVSSKDEMQQQLSDYIAANPHLHWVTARGFNEAGWSEGTLPTRHDLDKVSASKPIYVIRTCAHIAVCNTAALQAAGITAATPVPQGGVMQLGADGQPNGIFAETALGLVANKIPAYTKNDFKIMVRAMQQELYQYGITAATDPAVDPVLLQAYHEMNAAGELGFRLNALPIILPDGGTQPYPIPQKFSSSFFNINTVKFFSDGGLSGQTAALKRSYKNSTQQGVLRLQQQQYLGLCRQAMQNGLGVATHAIGDAAIEMVIDIYKQLQAAYPSLIKRVEHLGLPLTQHLAAMQANNIACSMQTIFLDELGKNFTKYLDDDYLQRCYPVRSVLQHGILTALSSDAPVVKNFNPLKGASVAVTRKANQGVTIAPNEAITMHQALKAYTFSAAQISGTMQWGALQKNKLADFIITDKNPLTTAADVVQDIKVLQTFVDGQCVYKAMP